MVASFSGILMTVLVLGVLIAIHEAGHFLAAKSLAIPVRQFAIGFGPRILGFQWRETEVRLNWIPLGGYCAFADDQQDEPVEGVAEDLPPEAYLRNRPIWQRVWVVSAGVVFNFVSAWFILLGSNVGLGVPTGNQAVGVKAVLPASPAAQAGLRPGDRLLAVDGSGFEKFEEFRRQLKAHKGQAIPVAVRRGDATVVLTATPDAEGRLGFQPTIRNERRPLTGVVDAIVQTNDQQRKITVMLADALYRLFSAPGKMMEQTGGPVAIVAMGDQVYQDDPWLLLEFAVVLSIELAIINLLPLPALDGGHLVFLGLEALRGRPLPRAIEERILVAGFLLVMGLGVALIVKDLFTVPGMYGPPKPSVAPAAPR
ncbi:MAG: site-2 protease family protein [Candidatus Sericytochromatia bacterium]|nr:site-2 protease family protein [Candidatus Sericytochromatia bacterium]